jgi:hypothetical protein
MDDKSAVIAEFCAITGAAPHIAENYLGAHDWDIGRASDFFFEHPPDALDEQHAPNHVAQADEGPRAAYAAGRLGPLAHAATVLAKETPPCECLHGVR